MKILRFGAEWAWDRMGVAANGEDPDCGYLEAGWYDHGSTGIVCAKNGPSDAYILGWRFDTTVRSISHEVLFGLVISPSGSLPEDSQVFTAWTHSAWREESQGDLPFSATKNSEAITLPPYGLLVPANARIWVYAWGWGHWYGAPLPANPTVMEFQGHVFVNEESSFTYRAHADQTFNF